MITVKNLKELLKKFPDDAKAIAYEGEGCGLCIVHEDEHSREKYGWIETGWSDDEECDASKHETDLTE